jgi:prophage regulatory protein
MASYTSSFGGTKRESPMDMLLQLEDVLRIAGFGRSKLHMKIKEGTFPVPVKTGSRTRVWREQDIRDWIKNLPTFKQKKA